MKNILIFLVLLNSFVMFAQQTMKPLKQQEPLLVSDITTTHLIFKEKLKYIDIGSPYFVADTIESIVKIKHTGEGLKQTSKSKKTNLTIIAKSGTYYSIPLYYTPNVEHTTYHIQDITEQMFKVGNEMEKKLERSYELGQLCDKFDYAQSNIILSNERDNLRIKVSGLFYMKNYIGIRMELRNSATIDFDIDKILIRFKLDKRLSPDYIYQERVLNPVKVCNETTEIQGGKTERIVMIFEQFTPNDNEKLYIDVFEKNGGRSSTIAIPRKKLLTPKTIATK